MTCDRMSPRTWLANRPLQDHERLYLIISAASDAEPLKAYYQQPAPAELQPIWSGTSFADWRPVMPYLTELKPGAPFLQWIADTDAIDWGWLAISSSTLDVVHEHLRSLTQVLMPNGTVVFFRFWDGRHIQPVLSGLGDKAGEILPMFDRYLINGRELQLKPRAVPPAKPCPWWQVPKALLGSMAERDPSTLINNLMQWLSEEHPDFYTAYPEGNLRHKVARFVRRPDQPDTLNEALLNYLILEQG
ncbi:DUF4123 domain-containing protein [Pseudomonas sp. SZMC_28357]|uniref:DUF4123 domain-containing protein n=1 Tax=Pseudomonas sp. SZMC_28357 TaxID=3074380 RepID=UPI002871D23D|nr:DUF4123 domain-containing protein [Pseudomonas sp. SZMC_28357]MDR9754991.1 DUF4123 domain-containing protein [Pseudomonas sp. SZMC_28357]